MPISQQLLDNSRVAITAFTANIQVLAQRAKQEAGSSHTKTNSALKATGHWPNQDEDFHNKDAILKIASHIAAGTAKDKTYSNDLSSTTRLVSLFEQIHGTKKPTQLAYRYPLQQLNAAHLFPVQESEATPKSESEATFRRFKYEVQQR